MRLGEKEERDALWYRLLDEAVDWLHSAAYAADSDKRFPSEWMASPRVGLEALDLLERIQTQVSVRDGRKPPEAERALRNRLTEKLERERRSREAAGERKRRLRKAKRALRRAGMTAGAR